MIARFRITFKAEDFGQQSREAEEQLVAQTFTSHIKRVEVEAAVAKMLDYFYGAREAQ